MSFCVLVTVEIDVTIDMKVIYDRIDRKTYSARGLDRMFVTRHRDGQTAAILNVLERGAFAFAGSTWMNPTGQVVLFQS